MSVKIEPFATITNIQVDDVFGPVGSIQLFDAWESRKSIAHAKRFVADIATLSYGFEEAKNPDALFDKLLKKKHMGPLEFVPFAFYGNNTALPGDSIRHHLEILEHSIAFSEEIAAEGRKQKPCIVAKVTCPLYTRSQWMRHRAAAYNELSRRSTLGKEESRVPFAFYGPHDDPDVVKFWDYILYEYNRRLDAGWPAERARGCIPMEALTSFYTGAYLPDWLNFFDQRADAHAQAEIRVLAEAVQSGMRLGGFL